MTLKAAKKEHKEHQKALKPLLSHLKSDENKMKKWPKEGPMKKQKYKDKDDESLGMRRGKESTKKQSFKSRRDEMIGSKKKKK